MHLLNRHRKWVFVLSTFLAVNLSACERSEDRVSSHMDRGLKMFNAGDYDHARLEYKNALQISPTNGQAYYELGRVYEAQRLFSEALNAYRQAVDQSPGLIGANIRLGRYYVLVGNTDKALAHAERVISASEGSNAEGYALRGAAYLARKSWDLAKDDAVHALGIDAANVSAAALMVGIHRHYNDLDAAIAALNQGLLRNPGATALRLTKLNLHLEQKNRVEAEKEAQAILAHAPEKLDFWISVSRLYVSWGKLEKAEAVLRNAVVRRPGKTEPKLVLVDFLANKVSPAVAEETLRQYIAAEPDNQVFRLALAELFRRAGQLEAAIDVLLQAVQAQPDSVASTNARAVLAALFYDSGNVDAASQEIIKVLGAEPGNTTALLVDAQIALQEKRTDDAVLRLRTILGVNPNSRQALALLSQAHLMQGRSSFAIDTLYRLIERDPANDGARIQLARLLANEGRFDRSVDLIDDLVARKPHHLDALSTKGRILVRQNSLAAATRISDTIDSFAPNSSAALDLRGRIASAEGRHAQAVAAFRRAHASAPQDWRITESLARSLMRTGKSKEAVLLLKTVVKQDAKDVSVQIKIGDLLSTERDLTPASDAYQQAVAANPRSIEARYRLAAMRYRLGDEEHAIRQLRDAAEANPENVPARVTLALALEKAGKFESAIGAYELLREKGHRDVVIDNNFASLVAEHDYRNRDRLLAATKTMESYANEERSAVLDTIGRLHHRAGNYEQAIAFLNRALNLDAGNDAIRQHLDEALLHAIGVAQSDRGATPAN